ILVIGAGERHRQGRPRQRQAALHRRSNECHRERLRPARCSRRMSRRAPTVEDRQVGALAALAFSKQKTPRPPRPPSKCAGGQKRSTTTLMNVVNIKSLLRIERVGQPGRIRCEEAKPSRATEYIAWCYAPSSPDLFRRPDRCAMN